MLIIMLYHFLKTVTLLAFFLTTTAPSLKAMEDLVDKPARDSDTTKSLTESEEGETTDRLHSNTNEYAAAPSGEDDTFIKPGNFERLLSTIRYSSCPQHSYNHPLIQGVLVFQAQHSGEDFLAKARAFYLLHIALKNKILQIQNIEEKKEYSDLANKFQEISRSLIASNRQNFEAQKQQWEELYVSIPETEKEQIKRLTSSRMNKKWIAFQNEYDTAPKYIDEAILLAQLIFNHKITTGTANMYLEFANTEYYAQGYIAMGDYVYKSDRSYAAEMYQKALLEHNDLRGYQRFVAIAETPTEEMERKKEELEKMHLQLNGELIRLSQILT